MANPEHVDVVQQGAEAIRKWRDKNLEVRLDLHGADLSGAHLQGADLHEADLGQANLGKVNLTDAVLFNANLGGADLNRARLHGAQLARADLSGADLSQADLSRAGLTQANLGGANLSQANLGGANLSRAHLAGAQLPRADLSGASLSQANLGKVNLTDAVLFNADLSGAILAGANLHRATLREADLNGADLAQATLAEADLTRANLTLVRGTHQARHLETVQLREGDAHYFERCYRPWPERWLDWERLRVVGRLPLFGVSYTALILIPIIFYGLALYNDKIDLVRAWAEQAATVPDPLLHRLARLALERLYPRPIPSQSFVLLLSTGLLAVGSTLYTFFCPSRMKEFSRDQWCDQLGRSLLHYWPQAWKHRYIRLACAACYGLGGAGALWVLGTKVGKTALFILKHSTFPWPWR